MQRDAIICILASLNLLIFSFIGLNGEAFAKMMKYQRSGHEISVSFDQSVALIQNDLSKHEEVKPNEANEPKEPKTFLLIPSLNVIAPIGDSLQEGVVKWENVLFGHSSDYWWNNNPYGTIFTLLPKIQKGAKITIMSGKEKHDYLVTSTNVTDANLTGIVSKSSDKNELILSTCYPIGFSSERFNVKAIPISKFHPNDPNNS